MPMNKPHLEFHKVDMDSGWATPSGYPSGIKQKILASDLDETRKMGGRTRLLKFDPGVYTTSLSVVDANGCSGYSYTGQTAYCGGRNASGQVDTLPEGYSTQVLTRGVI